MTLTKEVSFNVECLDCGTVFSPKIKSPLWWRAKKKADKGYLDALVIRGEECGCEEAPFKAQPNAPFRVFGYDMECHDFDKPFNSMIEAMRTFIRLNNGPDVVFISGVSRAVQERLYDLGR